MPNMQDMTAVNLDIGGHKHRRPVDCDSACIVLLTTGFGVKVGLVEENAERSSGLQF